MGRTGITYAAAHLLLESKSGLITHVIAKVKGCRKNEQLSGVSQFLLPYFFKLNIFMAILIKYQKNNHYSKLLLSTYFCLEPPQSRYDRRKSVCAEAYNPDDDDSDEEQVVSCVIYLKVLIVYVIKGQIVLFHLYFKS